MDGYQQFLQSKIEVARDSGFGVPDKDIHPSLLPHQRLAVRWAVKGGCRALFESFGLGKSVQQLEICRLIAEHEHGRALIVAPLDVRLEFQNDAQTLLGRNIEYVRTMAEVRQASEDILITNYERVRDGDIDPEYFAVTSLDEASVLRSYGSKTYQEFLPLFKAVPYKFVATATPSPNRIKELIHYAGYLGIMDTGQALTRFFQRDSTKANNLTLYPHKVDEFWLWVSTWALFINKPSDVGCDDTGYDLPPLDIRYHVVSTEHKRMDIERDGQVQMFRDANEGLSQAAREKRESIDIRVTKAVEIMAEAPKEHYILWHDTDAERDEIKRRISAATIITGSDDLEERAKNLYAFANGHIPIMATKKSISAAGGNFQRHCHRAIFVGIDHKFHDLIQGVHRVYRFLQTEPVRIDIILTESERGILDSLNTKWAQHNEMISRMTEIIKKYGLSTAAREKVLSRHIGVDRVEIKSERFTAVNNDCVEETAQMAENSVDLIHTSIPFGNHYEYSASYNDFGHNENNDRFFEQMDHLTPHLLRVLKPGRIFACHVKDRVLFGNATGTGMPEIDPFHAECIAHYMRHGFRYLGMIHIDTDVVRENNQTYRLGWTEQCKDGSKMGIGCPEYILIFRKLPTDRSTAYADEPVVKPKADTVMYSCERCGHQSTDQNDFALLHPLDDEDSYFYCPNCERTYHKNQLVKRVLEHGYSRAQWQIDAHAHWRSSGNRLMEKEELAALPVESLQKVYRKFSRNTIYNYQEHVELAKSLDEQGKLPAVFMVVAPAAIREDIWDDINRMRTLNTSQSQKGRQMHVCPLQLDIVERIINRYSNPGELIYDPFAGICTVGYMALKMGRRAYMTELNTDYFRDGVGYLKQAELEAATPSLFDFMEMAV